MNHIQNSENVEQTETLPEQTFTREQVDAILREFQQRQDHQEREQDWRGTNLPKEITDDLDNTPFHEVLQTLKFFKRNVKKYNNEEWIKPESINPNFTNQLKDWKIDALQVINIIYRITENTRVQARAAAELYGQLNYLGEQGQSENGNDWNLFNETIEQTSRLAIFGLGTAKNQENEARELALKAIRLFNNLKHLESSGNQDKKYAFDEEFVALYNKEKFQQKLIMDSRHSNGRGRGSGSTNGYFREHNNRGRGHFLSRGRGRGHSPQHQPMYQHSTSDKTNYPNNQSNQSSQ